MDAWLMGAEVPATGVRRQVNFDRMARAYRWLEYLSFGLYLEKTRLQFLPRLAGARRALVLGDGDGRFAAKLLAANSQVRVDAIDSSAAMLELLERPVQALGTAARERLTVHRADALAFVPATRDYDLVVAHFFLDCFSDAELQQLLGRIATHLAPGAWLVVSDFAVPGGGAMRPLALGIIGGLYRAFGIMTGLRVRRLPGYEGVLVRGGFRIVERRVRLFGLLVSELWEFRGTPVVKATGPVRTDSQGG